MHYVVAFKHMYHKYLSLNSLMDVSWLYKTVSSSCSLFPALPKNLPSLCFCTCTGQVQFSLAKPQLGSVNSAGVELNSEHHLPLCCSSPPMVALHLQTLMQENDHFMGNVLYCCTALF